MGKATIIEAQNSNTVYEEGKSKGILGKLKGIFADYKNGTRNADRLYTEDLWDNRVFGSEDVMEALNTKTLFGELDHPEGDRCETLAQNAAITITKLEKKPEEGVIYGEAEILDTPTGRIVKALADSGAQLGISSRGIGEEIMSEGRNIIDPETYDFITFDVVVTPANTKARVSLTESKHLNKLTESLKKEVKECETQNQLNQLKTVLESINVDTKNTLLEEVNKKLKSLEPKVEVNSKLQELNQSLALNLIRKKYTECNEQLNEALEAGKQLMEENTKLVEQNNFLQDSRQTLKETIKNSNKEISSLKENVNKETKRVQNRKQFNDTILKEMKKVETSYKTKLKEAQKEKEDLNNQIKTLNENISNLKNTNKQLSNVVEQNSKVIKENKETVKQLENKIKIMENKNKVTTNKLTESKKLQETKIKELEETVKQLQEQKERFSRLSFNPLGTVQAIAENYKTESYSEEELNLLDILANK